MTSTMTTSPNIKPQTGRLSDILDRVKNIITNEADKSITDDDFIATIDVANLL